MMDEQILEDYDLVRPQLLNFAESGYVMDNFLHSAIGNNDLKDMYGEIL